MKEMICIVCPRGCHLKVNDNNEVSGNFCPRGAKYAIEEIFNTLNIVGNIKEWFNYGGKPYYFTSLNKSWISHCNMSARNIS